MKTLLSVCLATTLVSCTMPVIVEPINFNADKFQSSPKFDTGKANPLQDYIYTADPTSIEFGGRLYVYGTYDQQQFDSVGIEGKNTYEKIRQLAMLSSDDMVNWTYHGTIKTGEIAPWIIASWAPSITSRIEEDGNTHFYLYYSNSGVGSAVLTATSPIGPWRDPIGSNVVDCSTPGVKDCPHPFDPGVVIDDDGVGWLAFGGGTAKHGTDYMPGVSRIIRLGKDMTSVDSKIVEIKAPYIFEASELNYINGTYVYTYNTNWLERKEWHLDLDKPTICCMSYMTTKTPLISDSWIYQDNYFKHPSEYEGFVHSYNHTHLHKYEGQYYILYHSQGLEVNRNLNVGCRSMCVDKIEIDEENIIFHMGIPTLDGVAQIRDLDPYIWQQAETTAATLGVKFIELEELGNMAAEVTQTGEAIEVRGVNFGNGARDFLAKIKGKGQIDVRSDSPNGEIIAQLTFDTNNWENISTKIQNKIEGNHKLFFILDGNFLFDKWRFKN